MLSFVKMINQRLRQRAKGIVAEADTLVKDYGYCAYMEAHRRTVEANDIATACYWDQVKAEIGRRIVHGPGDAAGAEFLASKRGKAAPDGCRLAARRAEERARADAIAKLIEVVAGERVDNSLRKARPADTAVDRVAAIADRGYSRSPLAGIPVVADGAGEGGDAPATPRFPFAAPRPARGGPSSRARR